jgi:hypothetical protein
VTFLTAYSDVMHGMVIFMYVVSGKRRLAIDQHRSSLT